MEKEKSLFQRMKSALIGAGKDANVLDNVPHLTSLPETPFQLDENFILIENKEHPQFSHIRFNCLDENGESIPYSISLSGLSGNVTKTDKDGKLISRKNRNNEYQFVTSPLNAINARNVESFMGKTLIATPVEYVTSREFSYKTANALENSERVQRRAYKITLAQ